MRILDPILNNLSLGTDEYSDTIGIVFKTDEEIGAPQLGVIIPKFMLGYKFKNGDKAMVEISRTENAEAWDITVTDKNGNESSWIGLPLDKAGDVTLLPDGQYLTDKDMTIDNMKKVMKK